MKNKYHNVGIFPKLNRKIVETCKVDIPSIHVHDLRLSLSIQSGGIILLVKRRGYVRVFHM